MHPSFIGKPTFPNMRRLRSMRNGNYQPVRQAHPKTPPLTRFTIYVPDPDGSMVPLRVHHDGPSKITPRGRRFAACLGVIAGILTTLTAFAWLTVRTVQR